MRKWLLLLLFFANNSRAQISEPLKELRSFVKNQPPKIAVDSTPYLDMFYKNGLHYFLPFYKAFAQEKRLIGNDTALYYEQLAQSASFIGDNSSMLYYELAGHERLADSTKKEIDKLTDAAKEITYTDARKYILNKARTTRVVMINEAHDKPQTRVFTASLLEDLYQQGYHYLAMEMLNRDRRAITKPTAFSGYYASEPIAGELIRKAVEIGYTLVPYEDTVSSHTENQHEYSQAQNIYRFLSAKDTAAKILVHAGYAHIKEASATGNIPMAAYFKIISGIDPLTVDQTEMIEGSTTAYCAAVYEQWMKKNPAIGPVVALKDNKAVDPLDLNLYDIHVITPPTRYVNARPEWVAMNGWKKETQVIPAFRTMFLVQAYYEKEYTEATVNQAVPADQTYQAAQNGIYYLYLAKGKYKLVCRDKGYGVLGTKDIEIK